MQKHFSISCTVNWVEMQNYRWLIRSKFCNIKFANVKASQSSSSDLVARFQTQLAADFTGN